MNIGLLSFLFFSSSPFFFLISVIYQIVCRFRFVNDMCSVMAGLMPLVNPTEPVMCKMFTSTWQNKSTGCKYDM